MSSSAKRCENAFPDQKNPTTLTPLDTSKQIFRSHKIEKHDDCNTRKRSGTADIMNMIWLSYSKIKLVLEKRSNSRTSLFS